MTGRAWTIESRTVRVVCMREMRDYLRSPLIWLLVAIASVLAVLATYVGIQHLDELRSRYRELQQQRTEDRARSAGGLHGAQVEPALRAIRSPERDSILVRGLEDTLPAFWDFGPSGVESGADGARSSAAENALDLEFLLRVVLGLLAILVAVDTIAGQRDRGELLALLGQPVRAFDVLLGKILGSTICLGAAVTAVLLASLCTTAVARRELLSTEHIIVLGCLGGAAILYAVACFAGGMALSVHLLTYRRTLTTTFVGWTIVALLSLGSEGVIAQAVAPAPTEAAVEARRARLYEQATVAVQDRMGDEYAAALGGGGAWIARQEDATLSRNAIDRALRVWDAHIAQLRRELERIDDDARRASARQRVVRQVFRILNPAAAFSAAATDLAGTGESAASIWIGAVDQYQHQMDQRLFDDRPRTHARVPFVDPDEASPRRRLLVALDRHRLPPVQSVMEFATPTLSLSRRLRDAAIHLTSIAVMTVGLLLITSHAFRRLRF